MPSAQSKWDRIYEARIASSNLTIFNIEANPALVSREAVESKRTLPMAHDSIENYDVGQLIGRGGCAEVYRAVVRCGHAVSGSFGPGLDHI